MIDREGFLKEIRNWYPRLGKLIELAFDCIDGTANHIGVNPFGKLAPPDAIKAINVKAGTDHMHVTLNDPSQVRKNVQYFIEYSTNPSFAGPHVEHLGASRSRVIALPAKDDRGNPVTYYVRGYSQHIGSDAQPQKTVFGGSGAPTGVTLSGS